MWEQSLICINESQIMKKVLLSLSLVALLTGCDQWFAKNVGGSYTVDLPCNQKFVNLAWKETNLWILSRPMYKTDTPEVYTLQEDSTTGILEGTVTIKECKSS